MGDIFDLPFKLLKAAAIIVVIAAALILAGVALGRCQEHGDYLIMDAGNLAFARYFLEGRGHQVEPHSGIALGKLIDREAGTGITAVKGRDRNGRWTCWVWETETGELVGKIKVYPAREPKENK